MPRRSRNSVASAASSASASQSTTDAAAPAAATALSSNTAASNAAAATGSTSTNTNTSHSAPTTTARTSKKRKSVAFVQTEDTPEHDQDEREEPADQQPDDSALTASTRTTRSRRTSTASATSQASAKALGKRRAVSPPAADEQVAAAGSSTSTSTKSSKRRKTATEESSTTASTSPRKLRSRSTSKQSSSNVKGKQRATASSASIAATPATSSKVMPRKGSRAQRAARAKARAFEDDDDDGDYDLHRYDHDDDEGDGDVFMADAPQAQAGGSTSAAATAAGKKKAAMTADLASSPPPPPAAVARPGSDKGRAASARVSESGSIPRRDGGEGSEGSHDDDDDDDEDDEDDEDDDDEDEDGEGFGSGSQGSETIDSPRTFDEDGSAMHSDGDGDAEGMDAEAAAAEAAALFGSGGISFRALQGLMSGMSGRLKGLLGKLKDKSSGSSAKLVALQDLAELLSVSTEDTLAGYFQVDSFTKELVSILRGDSNTAGLGGGGGDGAMSAEEMIAFGMDPSEAGAGGGGSEENDVQMMLLACRCLANLMEALPGSAHSVVYAGAVPVLCSKLLEIQYIDLAEQTLSTLEKISEEVPSSIVRGGGLSALLNFLDFFSFHVQRTAVTAAANCCRSLSLDSFSLVQEVMPIFKNILGYPDQRVVEQGCLAVVRITDSYRHFPDKLEALLSADVLTAVRALLNPDSTSVGPNTHTQMLKMLSTAAKASPGVAIMLVELNIANTLYHLLTGVPAPEFPSEEGLQVVNKSETGYDDMLVMQNLVQRPKEQVQETLNIVCELLPALPKDGIFALYSSSGKSRSSKVKVKREDDAGPVASTPAATPASRAAALGEETPDIKMELVDVAPPPVVAPAAASSSAAAISTGTASSSNNGSRSGSRSGRSREQKEALMDKRVQHLRDDSTPGRKLVVNRFFALMLPILVDICAASVSPQVRSKAVLGLLKMVNFCDTDELTAILQTVSMASFLAAILSSRDQSSLVTNALQLVELLLVKMPDAYQYHFRREGVMHEIEQIAEAQLVAVKPKSKQASPARTPKEATSSAVGTSSSSSSLLSRALQQSSALDANGSTLTPVEAQARDAVTLRARHLRDTYGAADSEPALRARSALDEITNLVDRLSRFSAPTESTKNDKKLEEDAKETLAQVAALFSDEKNPLSGFELLESGLVEGLLKFTSDNSVPALPVHRREELFAAAFMSRLESGSTSPAFSLLVKRLQESLSRMEQFDVEMAAQTAYDAGDRRNGPSMLARQLKLRLVAEEGSDIPRSCTNIVVSIHAIATFQAFNDYLRPRILAATTLAGGSSSGTNRLSSFLAAFAAANGASSPPPSGLSEPSSLARGLGLPSPDEPAPAAGPSTSASKTKSDEENDKAAVPSGKKSPARRRSRRLSGKGVDDGDDAEKVGGESTKPEASSSRTTLDDAPPPPAAGDAAPLSPPPGHEDDEGEHMDDEEFWEEDDDDLFAGGFEAQGLGRDERPVNLEVAGDSVVAKTPDGTRVATPTSFAANAAGVSAARPAAAKPRASYAAAVKSEPTDFHLEFSMGGQDIKLDTTVYGAVHRHASLSTEAQRLSMWSQIYEIRFRKVAGPARVTPTATAATAPSSRPSGAVVTDMPSSIPADSQQAKILQLLSVLHRLNSDFDDDVSSATLAESAFVNNKLTAKLNRQLEEPMIVASACLPSWATDLPAFFPFLFPFETRYTFLQSTAFGYARLMQKWVGQARTDNSRRDDNLGFLGRLQRQKVRISRERMLESAFKVFELYGASRASLEVEFFAEVGGGLGPTLEFYALVSKEFARKDLDIWRHGDSADSTFVHNALGLFPAPAVSFDGEAGQRRLKVFRVMGQFVAKSMMDTRIIDVHFSRMFMRLVLDQDVPLTIGSVKSVDKNLGTSLAHLQELLDTSKRLGHDDFKFDDAKAVELAEVAASVEDMTLDFTLPGYEIELKKGGAGVAVELANLEEYISLVIDWTVRKGVQTQLQEFKNGFCSVFPVRDLQSFTPAELVMMTGAIDEDWSVECLTNSTKADHGFTMDSRPVRDLLSIMSEFSPADRREFLSFTTGSPRLPIGGFSALTPALTIVRKDGGDGSLFSTMTCANFLKLPNYSSRGVVKERVLFAIREGQGGFHLS